MDFGLYNKHPVFAGRHGTLIGNWKEETALPTPLDRTRPRYVNTKERVIAHYDNCDSTPKLSVYQSEYHYSEDEVKAARELNTGPNQRQLMLARIEADAEAGRRKQFETSYQCSIGFPKRNTRNLPPTGTNTTTVNASTEVDKVSSNSQNTQPNTASSASSAKLLSTLQSSTSRSTSASAVARNSANQTTASSPSTSTASATQPVEEKFVFKPMPFGY